MTKKETTAQRKARELVETDCPLCGYEHREVVEAAVLTGKFGNAEAARRFGFEGELGGIADAGEVVRQHRLQGHAPARAEVEGRAFDYAAAEGHALIMKGRARQ